MSERKNETRFHGIDFLLTLLCMAALLLVIWQMLASYERKLEESTTVTCTMVVENCPEAAVNKVGKGDTVYAEDGSVIGRVVYASYPRQGGQTMRMILKVEAVAKDHYGGYLFGNTLVTVGEQYAIHTDKYGGSAVCYAMETEDNP